MPRKQPWQSMRLVRVGHVASVVRQGDNQLSPPTTDEPCIPPICRI